MADVLVLDTDLGSIEWLTARRPKRIRRELDACGWTDDEIEAALARRRRHLAEATRSFCSLFGPARGIEHLLASHLFADVRAESDGGRRVVVHVPGDREDEAREALDWGAPARLDVEVRCQSPTEH